MSSNEQFDAPVDNDYKSRTGQSEIPVQSDEAAVEATEYDAGGDSDKQLGKFNPPLTLRHILISYREGREGSYQPGQYLG
jgi:hypothetical protein